MRGALIEGLLTVISSTGRQLSRHGAAASESCTSSTNLGSLSTIQNAALIAVRQISNTAILGSKSKEGASETIDVTFKDEKDGSVKTVQVPLGTSLLEAAHENHIDLEGACEGSLACSTCHVIVEDAELYEKLPEPDDDENDMLDLAFGLTETSRLGCQIIASKELDGLEVKIPSATRNFAVDGYVPKPH